MTDLINNTFIRSEFGIAIGPENSGKVRRIRWVVLGFGQGAGFSGPSRRFSSASLSLLYSGLQVILSADVSGGQGSRIFVSNDFGKSFTHQELPFMPLMQITYNPENSRVLTALSSHVSGAWRSANV